MDIRRTLTIFTFALGLTAFTAGCAGDTSDDAPTTEDEGESTDEVISGKKYHYAPINASVHWKPGCGQQPPDGRICQMGLFIKYTRAYIDLQVTKSAKYDSATNTLTVTLDTWSTSKTHPLTIVALMPQEERLELSGAEDMPIRFKVRVVDWKGGQLFAGEIAALPAP